MKKLLYRFIVLVPIVALLFTTNHTKAQDPKAPLVEEDFEYNMINVVQIDDRTLEFDVYLLDTDPSQPLEFALNQCGILYNQEMLDGAPIVNGMTTIIPGSSQIYTVAYPNTNTAVPGLIKISGSASTLGCDGQPLISTTYPGTRVYTVRFTNSQPFKANSTPDFVFVNNTVGLPLYPTRFAHYRQSDCMNTQLPVTYGVNAFVRENPVLNPSSTPTVFNVTGGGSYCAGSEGISVGLDDSEADVNYELFKDGVAFDPPVIVPGSGEAISFGPQLAGSYTVTGTNAGGSIPMNGSAVITEEPLVTSSVTLIASGTTVCEGSQVTFTATAENGGATPFYNWYVNDDLIASNAENTFTYVPQNNDEVHVVLIPDQLCSAGSPTSNEIVIVVNPLTTQEHTEEACDTYTWAVNGETYTSSGDYTYVDGCVTHILHLTITPSSTEEHTEAACDEFTWTINGETYTESGDYTYVDGCVTHILHLTITPSSTEEYTEAACDEFTWSIDGETYTESGDYTYVDGCVTHILHLTITPSSTEEYTEAACDEFTWSINGETYTESGDYTYIDGCVTHILHLTITPSGSNEYTVTACDEYYWPISGETYTESGDYTSMNECSTNILHLTIYPSTLEEIDETACDSFFWETNGETYTESGDYTYVSGCNTVILHLTIIPSSTEEFTESACDSYTWDLNDETYTVSGDYTYVDGCATYILHLTITPSSTEEFTVTAVGSYTWEINGVTYTESGDYTYVDGCATYILHLTITTVPCPDYSTWNGNVSDNWFDAANWTPEALPCVNTMVTIPGGRDHYPTLTDNVSIAGLTINDGGSFIGQQLISVGSDVIVERTISNSNFHLIGSPVNDVTFGDVFLPQYWFEVWARVYNEATGFWENRFIADHLEPGAGYSVQMTTAPQTATFTGTLNTSDVTRTLSSVNPGNDLDRIGWNLLGNPFPSAIDWDYIPAGHFDAQVAVWDESGAGNYIYWNGSVGSLVDGLIPTQNGFFVKTNFDGATLTIPIEAQVHHSAPLYKNAVSNTLELRAEGNNYYDAIFVRFNEFATSGFDHDFDAFKLDGLETAPQLYTIADYRLSINELPFEGNEIVKVGFTCGIAGTYTLKATGIESFSGSTPILLEDTKLNIFHDLRLNPEYSFNYQPGDNANRFNLHFKSSTGLVDGIDSGIRVFSHDHTVVINNTTGMAGEVQIYDLSGRELLHTNIGSSTSTRIPMQVAIGTYVVKVITPSATVNQKVFIH